MAGPHDPSERQALSWPALVQLAVEEGDSYLSAVARDADWAALPAAAARAVVARTMLMHGLELGMAFALLDPDVARTVYDEVTAADPSAPEPSAAAATGAQIRLAHFETLQRFRALLERGG